MAQNATGPALSYGPPPHELPYYDGLFAVADKSRGGSIGGKDAVAFLALSKLPMDHLKNIWTMADNPKSNTLDRSKFHVAVRLIQLTQNGKKAQDPTLSCAEESQLRPAYFEGVSGVSVQPPQPAGAAGAPPAQPTPAAGPVPPPTPQQQPQPTPQQQPPQPQQQPTPITLSPQQAMQQQAMQQQSTQNLSLTTHDAYNMLPTDQSRYESLFPQYEVKKDGFVYGAEAVALFSKSGMDKSDLRDLWTMVDEPVDNRLDKLEFAMAMHLIVCVTKKGMPLPKSLPASLRALKEKARGVAPAAAAAPVQQQMQPPAAQPPAAALGASMPPQQQQQPAAMQQHPPSPGMSSIGTGMMVGQQPGMMSAHGGGTHVPPPPPGVGGVSISDAFEDLHPDTASVGYSLGGGTATSVSAVPPPVVGYGGGHQGGPPALPQQPVPEEAPAVPPQEINVRQQSQQADDRKMSMLSMKGVSQMIAPQDASSPSPNAAESVEQSVPTGAANASVPTGGANVSSYKMEDDASELAKLRAAHQKLQAEAISLRAQLSTVSEEDLEVKKELSATISEIATLSQELVGLRAEVAEAKASLIEATAELKAQKEKKATMTDLVGDARATRDAISTANEDVRELNQSMAAAEISNAAKVSASNTFESDLFGFDSPAPAPEPSAAPAPVSAAETAEPAPAPASAPVPVGAMGGDSANPFSVQHSDASALTQPAPEVEQKANGSHQSAVDHFGVSEPPFASGNISIADESQSGAVGAMNEANPYMLNMAPPAPHSSPDLDPMPMGGGQPTGGAQPPPTSSTVLNPNSFGHNAPVVPSSPSDQDIENMRSDALQAAHIADEAEQTAQRLSTQVEELKRAADKAESEAKEKQSAANKKKKGLGRGNKKATKNLEKALQSASAQRQKADEAQSQLENAQNRATQAKKEADELRQQIEQAELEAAAAASVMEVQAAEQKARADAEAKQAAYARETAGTLAPAVAPGPMGGQANTLGYGASESSFDSAPVQQNPYMNSGVGMSNGSLGIMGGSGSMGLMGGSAAGSGSMGVMGGSTGSGIPSPGGSDAGDNEYQNPFAI